MIWKVYNLTFFSNFKFSLNQNMYVYQVLQFINNSWKTELWLYMVKQKISFNLTKNIGKKTISFYLTKTKVIEFM